MSDIIVIGGDEYEYTPTGYRKKKKIGDLDFKKDPFGTNKKVAEIYAKTGKIPKDIDKIVAGKKKSFTQREQREFAKWESDRKMEIKKFLSDRDPDRWQMNVKNKFHKTGTMQYPNTGVAPDVEDLNEEEREFRKRMAKYWIPKIQDKIKDQLIGFQDEKINEDIEKTSGPVIDWAKKWLPDVVVDVFHPQLNFIERVTGLKEVMEAEDPGKVLAGKLLDATGEYLPVLLLSPFGGAGAVKEKLLPKFMKNSVVYAVAKKGWDRMKKLIPFDKDEYIDRHRELNGAVWDNKKKDLVPKNSDSNNKNTYWVKETKDGLVIQKPGEKKKVYKAKKPPLLQLFNPRGYSGNSSITHPNTNYSKRNSSRKSRPRISRREREKKKRELLYKSRTGGLLPFPTAVSPYADGGFVNKTTLSYVGEDGPEAIIPLGSKRRQRGLDLWNQAGAMLGVPGYANGAIVGGKSAGSVKKSKKTAVHKTESKGKTSANHKKSPVKVSVGNISINVKGNGGGSAKNVDLLELLKAQKGQVSDELCSIIADAVEGAYKNIPVA